MDTIADRLRWILETRDLSARALSKKAGLAEGHVGLIIRGTVGKGVAADTLNKIAAAGGVNAHWLSTGEGPIEMDSPVQTPAAVPGATQVPDEIPETLGQRKEFDKQARAARKRLAAQGKNVDEWVWPHVAGISNFTLSNSPPSVAMLCELALVIADHGDPSVKPKK